MSQNLIWARAASRCFRSSALDQPPDHRPVLVSLRLLGLHQIRQRQQVALHSVWKRNGAASVPEFAKRIDAAHSGHHVNAQVKGFGMPAAKMNGVTAPQILQFERRNGDRLGL